MSAPNYWGTTPVYKPGEPGHEPDVSMQKPSIFMRLGTAAGWVALAALIICGLTGSGQ